MAVDNWVSGHLDQLVAFRRDLHSNPELLYDLPRTAAEVAKALRAAGCDELQGYHFARPMAADTATAWLQDWIRRHAAVRGGGLPAQFQT